MEKDGTIIMLYIALKDNKIIHTCETQSQDKVIASMEYEGSADYDEIREIPDPYFQGKIGNDIREFDSNYKLLPLSQRIEYIEIPEGMKIEGEKFIQMSVKEKIDAGLVVPSDSEIWDEELEQLRPKKLSELFADGLLKLSDYINDYVRPARNYQLDRVDIVYCNALNLSKMSAEKVAEWDTYKQALKDLPDNVTEVKDDVMELFPAMPK